MNGFEIHGIDHLSASQANLFTAQPALWAIEKLLGKRAPVGCSAHRGSAAEIGVEYGLFQPQMPVERCVEQALHEYDKLTALSPDPNRAAERDAIPGIVTVALGELRQYGVPTAPPQGRQHRIEIRLDDVPVPIVGYLDFCWFEHGICLDLKTQLRLASDISDAHARQTAIYHKALGNHQLRVAYTTPKKIGVYPLENAGQRLEEVRQIFIRMGRFLSLSKDKAELLGVLVPDFSSFYWNNAQARALGREVYGW